MPNFWFSCDCISDIIFLFDIVVQLRTGYLEQGLMVSNFCNETFEKMNLNSVQKYVKSFFFFFFLNEKIPQFTVKKIWFESQGLIANGKQKYVHSDKWNNITIFV